MLMLMLALMLMRLAVVMRVVVGTSSAVPAVVKSCFVQDRSS
jgi:hypothetical protein